MTSDSIWHALQDHYDNMSSQSMGELFSNDPERANIFAMETDNLYIDYSKNRISTETLLLLQQFAVSRQLDSKIEQLFSGKNLNTTENRPALHTALRCSVDHGLIINNQEIYKDVSAELGKIETFVNDLSAGNVKGHSDKSINTVVNIGIGGSDLGPRFVVEALSNYRSSNIGVRFISNIDPVPLDNLLNELDPENTLFIISSKSFSTVETLQNAKTIKSWLESKDCDDITRHFVAVTANTNKALDFGIGEDRIFKLWDWVGGRYSLWSATGLPIAISIGYENFRKLLSGAEKIDQHFQHSPAKSNAPVILALLDFWYASFFNAQTHAFIPYDGSLSLLPEYLSQLFMESNGKTTTHKGEKTSYQTSPVIWGSTGTNAQHAFFQLLHQGSTIIPIDLLAPLKRRGKKLHHDLLFSNCIAQAQALMLGASNTDPHKSFPGNKPSTLILYKELTPQTLGELLALFEHRVFVQSVLWDINPFDQWGVELGKKMANNIFCSITQGSSLPVQDPSTERLLKLYKDINQ